MSTPAPGDVTRATSTALAPMQPNYTGKVVVRGQGSWVWDDTGARYLDLVSGLATLSLGHGHPEVLEAAQKQMQALAHTGGAFLSEPIYAYADALADIAPQGLDRVLFSATGAAANESAIHMARLATGRTEVIAFRGGFHGRTEAALAASTSRAAFRSGIVSSDFVFAPFPHVEAPGVEPDELAGQALSQLDEIQASEVLPTDVAAYLVEPVQGLGGCYPAGRSFLQGLRERADRNGIVLIYDEVQTGIGRTGEWFAAQRYSVAPDALTAAKALGDGFPISALVARGELMDALRASGHGSTFGGSPVACAAGLKAIEVQGRDGLHERVRTTGAYVKDRLEAIAGMSERVRVARGIGYMLALACRDEGSAVAISRTMAERGVLAAHSGTHDNIVRLIPPLNITDDELEFGLRVIEDAVRAVDEASLSTSSPDTSPTAGEKQRAK